MDTTAEFDLTRFRLHASIDFVTIRTRGKCGLPALFGKAKWVVSENYKMLTIHDLRPADVAPLLGVFPDARILEIEVAVDLIPIREVTDPDVRRQLIEAAHRFIALHAQPFDHPLMKGRSASTYIPRRRGICPFNYRKPAPDEQLLYALRYHPAQVKGYFKKKDNRQPVPEARQGMRLEVALRQEACESVGLTTLEDLIGFRFRRLLSPFFRMADLPVCTRKRTTRWENNMAEDWRDKERRREIARVWPQHGVQGILGHEKLPGHVRFTRMTEVNQRIGKSLNRLQDEFGCIEAVTESVGLSRSLPQWMAVEIATRIASDSITAEA